MFKLDLSSALGSLLAGSALLASSAQAHINMVAPLQSRDGDQKVGPCEGKDWGSGPVYTFEPGATVQLTAEETISHDGYFRIAFSNNGDNAFVDPVSIDPVNPDRYGPGQKCAPNDPTDHCGQSDFCKFVSDTGGPTVLWDDLDPHIPNGLLNGKQWSWKVTLPNVECTKCTLQVIQVMEDANAFVGTTAIPTHGPFDGTMDLYHRCIDIVIKRGAGNTPGTVDGPADNNGMNCVQAMTTDAGMEPPSVVVGDAGAAQSGGEMGTGGGTGTGANPGTGNNGAGPSESGSAGSGSGDGAGSDSPTTAGSANAPAADSGSNGCSVHSGGHAGSSWPLFGVLALLVLAMRRLARSSTSGLRGQRE